MLQSIASHLEQHQYVVCDSYIPLDMVIEARKELKVMEDHYEPGEIWVSDTHTRTQMHVPASCFLTWRARYG